MPWVFDASITMAWCFDDERTAETDALLDRLKTDPATVPQIWHLEVANVLTLAMRKKGKARLTAAQRGQFLALLEAAPIHVDELTCERAWSATLELADQYALSAYDAAYLEVAIRMGVELATLDADLRKAAGAAGVRAVPA